MTPNVFPFRLTFNQRVIRAIVYALARFVVSTKIQVASPLSSISPHNPLR